MGPPPTTAPTTPSSFSSSVDLANRLDTRAQLSIDGYRVYLETVEGAPLILQKSESPAPRRPRQETRRLGW